MSDQSTGRWHWGPNQMNGCGRASSGAGAERFHHHSRSGGGGWSMAGMGGPGAFGPWGRGPRARRGDMRISILALLAEKEMHGYQIIQELTDRSGGAWRPSPGSVYPTLQLLEDEGLVSGTEVEGRRVYALTDAGREVIADRPDSEKMPWEEAASGVGEGTQALREVTMQVGAAVWQVGGSGSPEQVQKAVAILEETRKKIYGILAEGE
jgi:DNA-binding PadR family transcriptional regulator